MVLLRSKTPSGRYERVQTRHSWNSNYNIGRIVLYELTRHSDHHFKSAKKYQLLETHKESPHLPRWLPCFYFVELVSSIVVFCNESQGSNRYETLCLGNRTKSAYQSFCNLYMLNNCKFVLIYVSK